MSQSQVERERVCVCVVCACVEAVALENGVIDGAGGERL